MSSEIIKAAEWDESQTPEWLEKINWEEYEKLAAIGYTPEKIAMFYNVKKIEFMFYFMLIDSELKYHYDRGILYHQAREGMAMVDDADTNTTQAQRLDKLRAEVNFQRLKEEIVYGGL